MCSHGELLRNTAFWTPYWRFVFSRFRREASLFQVISSLPLSNLSNTVLDRLSEHRLHSLSSPWYSPVRSPAELVWAIMVDAGAACDCGCPYFPWEGPAQGSRDWLAQTDAQHPCRPAWMLPGSNSICLICFQQGRGPSQVLLCEVRVLSYGILMNFPPSFPMNLHRIFQGMKGNQWRTLPSHRQHLWTNHILYVLRADFSLRNTATLAN